MDSGCSPLRYSGPWGLDGTNLPLSAPATPCPGVASGVRVNLGEQGGKRQLTPPSPGPSRSLRASFSCSDSACPKMDKPKLPIAGEFWEVRDDPGEDLER